MKQLHLTLLSLLCSMATMAQGWPSSYGGVMLQAFYWDSYDDTQWAVLQQQADEMAGTFDLVWLPQSGDCGGMSMGYDDLYWFPGHYDSSFGTEAQLRSLITAYRLKGIKCIADVVINHRRNLSSWTDFPAETYKGVTYQLTYNDICSDDEAANSGYKTGPNKDTGEGWNGMRDLDHKSSNVQTNVEAYLGMLLKDLGYAGFRYDMVKGYAPEYTGLYNSTANPEFSVGECWDGSNTIRNWIEGTKVNGQIQSAAFDFQFRYTVRNAMNNRTYNNLAKQNDNNWPLVSSSFENGKYRRWAVTFIENHDTEHRSNGSVQDPLKKDTLAANAYMLAMPGTPCVFMKHWQAYPSQIKAMVAARRAAGITNESSYLNYRNSTSYYANIIKRGNDNCLLVALGDVKTVDQYVNTEQWAKVLEGYHYAYYLPTSMETAYADLPGGIYTGEQKVRLTAVTTKSDAKLVYTTDGSTPTATSNSIASGNTVTMPVGKTTLRVAMLSGSLVTGSISKTYDIRNKEEQQTVIPSFCTVADDEVCAFFEAPATWGNTIHCWAWTNSPSDNFTYANSGWPGVECTLLGTAGNGNKVWKWTWDGTKQNNSAAQKPVFIIFNNNGQPQTGDLTFENGGYYNKDGLKDVVKSGIDELKIASPSTSGTVYSMDGRIVTSGNQKKGIYISNGRKVIVR